ncbi:hypothetical protein [Chrysiogenes arsenatis]|uniref:hypothetical protein n=1 Tax=Chrysiogenes arsenatis TaxID=309797 RepID=UPI00042547E4|nr:hypothetical protein [Chrysiogenes arsenatis]
MNLRSNLAGAITLLAFIALVGCGKKLDPVAAPADEGSLLRVAVTEAGVLVSCKTPIFYSGKGGILRAEATNSEFGTNKLLHEFTTPQASFLDEHAVVGTTYRYTCITIGRFSSKSGDPIEVTFRALPEAPIFQVTPEGSGALLTWQTKETGSVEILRSTDGRQYAPVATVEGDRWWDQSVNTGRRYWYRVALRTDQHTVSAPSEALSITLSAR